jgi:hypothetical protein
MVSPSGQIPLPPSLSRVIVLLFVRDMGRSPSHVITVDWITVRYLSIPGRIFRVMPIPARNIVSLKQMHIEAVLGELPISDESSGAANT